MTQDLRRMRREFQERRFDAEHALDDPLEQFRQWFGEAVAGDLPDANAMTLCTVDARSRPHARVVLLKGVDDGFVFFTNYESDKGRDLSAQPDVAIVFFWPGVDRQVRVEGRAVRVDGAESDAYFEVRPRGSQIGAWASPQSQRLASREELVARFAEAEERFRDRAVERPPHWGGFRVVPERLEFWQGRENRLHDRVVYERNAGGWTRGRLAP